MTPAGQHSATPLPPLLATASRAYAVPVLEAYSGDPVRRHFCPTSAPCVRAQLNGADCNAPLNPLLLRTSQVLHCIVQHQVQQLVIALQHTSHCRRSKSSRGRCERQVCVLGWTDVTAQQAGCIKEQRLESCSCSTADRSAGYQLVAGLQLTDDPPSLPPASFTRMPLSTNLARSRALSFFDMLLLCVPASPLGKVRWG